MRSTGDEYVGLVHLELSGTSTKRSNIEGNSSRLGVSGNNDRVGTRNSEGRKRPLRREFVIKEWNSLLEVDVLR
jgi:hypothetical protein